MLVILRVTIVTTLELYHINIWLSMIVHLIGKSVPFVVTRLMLPLTNLTMLVILRVTIVITLELLHIITDLNPILLHIGNNVQFAIIR